MITETTSNNLLYNAAEELSLAGLGVIPLAKRSKIPALASWAEYQKRQSDASERFEWFGDRPDLNIGVVCGWVSGDGNGRSLVVLDFDEEGFYEAFALANPDLVRSTWVAQTAKGYHVYLRANGRIATRKIAGGDLKGEGGYVVCPPSVHPGGLTYTWANKTDKIAIVDDLSKLIPASVRTLAAKIPERIPNGERNTTLTSLAGTMRRRGASTAEILAALRVANDDRCDPSLPDSEVVGISESIGRYDPATTEQKFRKQKPQLGQKLSKVEAQTIEDTAIKCPLPQLKDGIQAALLGEGSYRVKREIAIKLMLDTLEEEGQFIKTPITGDTYYLFKPEGQLLEIGTRLWHAWLYAVTGANAAGTDFNYLKTACDAKALLEGTSREVARVAHWDGQVLRVSRFDNKVYCLDGDSITLEANGKSVLFNDSQSWVPYSPEMGGTGETLEWSIETLPHWAEDPEIYALALKAWLLGTFFTELCPTKPILLMLGPKDSSKTTTLGGLLRLMFGPGAQVAGLPAKVDGLIAMAGAAHILAIDNLDDFTRWARDKLAMISTGGQDVYRKLYTNNEAGQVLYQCWPAMTARTPDTLKRDDLADRMLIFPVSPIPNNERKAEHALREEEANKRNAWWGDVLRTLNQVVKEIRENGLPETVHLRLADYERLGRLISRIEGREDDWDKLVKKVKLSQSNFLLEDEPIVDAIGEWLDKPENYGREMMARELYEEFTLILFGDKRPSGWPQSARSFSGVLTQLRQDLARIFPLHWKRGTTAKQFNRWVYWFEKSVKSDFPLG